MTAQEFTGHVRAMRAENDWFGAEDFAGSDPIPLQIAKVWFDADLVIGGKKADAKYYLTFRNAAGKDCRKKMSINATRRKMLSLLYGGVSAEWQGKWVWIGTTEVRDPQTKGAKTLGMVILNRKDSPKQNAPTPREPDQPATEQTNG